MEYLSPPFPKKSIDLRSRRVYLPLSSEVAPCRPRRKVGNPQEKHSPVQTAEFGPRPLAIPTGSTVVSRSTDPGNSYHYPLFEGAPDAPERFPVLFSMPLVCDGQGLSSTLQSFTDCRYPTELILVRFGEKASALPDGRCIVSVGGGRRSISSHMCVKSSRVRVL